MNKFEKLIEYVINDETTKAKNLFHQIVVAKSRNIYEGLMNNDIGGDQVDDLLNAVEAEENGMHEDDEMGMDDEMGIDDEMGMDDEMGIDDEYSDEMEPEGELEDRVVDLADKLGELMAEFDNIVSSVGSDDNDMEMSMDDDSEYSDEMEPEGDSEYGDEMEPEGELEESLRAEIDENVTLTKVSKGIANKTEGQSVGAAGEKGVTVNKNTINNDNSGKKGAMANPVAFSNSEHSNNAKISVKHGDSTTEPRQSNVAKPKNSEDGSTNKKSVQESKRRGRPLGSKNKKPTGRRPSTKRRV